MATKKLTDLTEKTSGQLLTSNAFYLVDTTDPTDDPAGTSFRTNLGAMIDEVQTVKGGAVNGLATLDAGGTLTPAQIPSGSLVTSFNTRVGAVVPAASDYDGTQIDYANTDGFLEPGDVTTEAGIDRLADWAATVGQVKINTGNAVQPVTNNVVPSAGTPSPEQIFDYDLPLGLSSSPTTTWPRMVATPTDADIWDDTNTSFLENLSLGQVHEWRCQFSYNKPASPTSKFIISVRLFNPLSGFSLTQQLYISEEVSSGDFIFQFKTIADSASLPSPLGTGNGYQLGSSIVGDNGSTCDITLISMTRHSTFNTFV